MHGNDFMALGDANALKEVDALLRSAYELKWLGTIGGGSLSQQTHSV